MWSEEREEHTSPLCGYADFFEDKIEPQCAHADPPAPPARGIVLPTSTHTYGSPSDALAARGPQPPARRCQFYYMVSILKGEKTD